MGAEAAVAYIRTMDLGLQDKVVMVTGGAGRIGPVICATFGREGAALGVLDVAADRASATAAQLRESGIQAIGIGVDVSRAADVSAALQQVTTALGPVDVLVNAHGISPNCLLLQADEEEWDQRGSGGAIENVSFGAATSARQGLLALRL